jgi:hypothetical protein
METGNMDQNAKTTPNIDACVSSAEAHANGLAAVAELTISETRSASHEDTTFFVRADAASHSQFDR